MTHQINREMTDNRHFFKSETMQGRKRKGSFKRAKRGQPRIRYPLNISLKTEGKTFFFFFFQIEWKEFLPANLYYKK